VLVCLGLGGPESVRVCVLVPPDLAQDRATSATAPTSEASGPVAAVLAGARRRNRVAATYGAYDETGHRTGPRKQKTQHIADAKIATGRLMAEIKIGPRRWSPWST
jgi:hypothetical protein